METWGELLFRPLCFAAFIYWTVCTYRAGKAAGVDEGRLKERAVWWKRTERLRALETEHMVSELAKLEPALVAASSAAAAKEFEGRALGSAGQAD